MNTHPVVQHAKKPLALSSEGGIKATDSEFPQNCHPILQAYTESMLLRRLSPVTSNIYLKTFKRFLSHHPQSNINALGHRELSNYLKAQSVIMQPAALKQTMAAIKFYYECTLGRKTMRFSLPRDKGPTRLTLYLPFYDLTEITDNIDSPGDKLLLFLVYHASLRLSEICKLPKDANYIFQRQLRLPGNDLRAIQYFKGLVAECNDHYHQKIYLIENEGQAHTLTTLKRKLFRILAHYRLEDIYRKQYQELLKQTNFSPRTRAMYLNAFMQFLKHFNYKHPAIIRDEDILNYRAWHHKKTIGHQNLMISSLKFFFEKIHQRPLSRQHVLRPRKNEHLPHLPQPETSAQQGITSRPKHKLQLAWGFPTVLVRQEIQHLHRYNHDFKHPHIASNVLKGNKAPKYYNHHESEALSAVTANRNHSPP